MVQTAYSAELSPWGERIQQRGAALLADPLLNKGTAFTERERDALGLRGLLPPRVFTLEEQVQRSLAAVRRKTDPLEKYIYLSNLQNRNEVLFHRLVTEHVAEMVPLIYTPTGRVWNTEPSTDVRAACSSPYENAVASLKSFGFGRMRAHG